MLIIGFFSSLYFSVKFLFHCYHDQVDLHAIWNNLTTEKTYSTTIFAGKTPDDPMLTIAVCRFRPFDSKYDVTRCTNDHEHLQNYNSTGN